MNGEIAQMYEVVCNAKKALVGNCKIGEIDERYISKIEFAFLPKKQMLFQRSEVAYSVGEWYEMCCKRGLADIKLMMPTKVGNRMVLGFVNTSQAAVVCFWRDKKVTYFVPKWEMDRNREGWEILYQEMEWENAPSGIPIYENQTEDFKQVLVEIETLAEKIGATNFAKIFRGAYDYLEAGQIYEAVNKAAVFGGMGSWNDDPAGMAYEKGLESEYNELSNRLLEQVRYHVMYAANELY